MKVHANNLVEFRCDGCGDLLAVSKYESDALKLSREVARAKGWIWKHPHWQVYCPACQSIKRNSP